MALLINLAPKLKKTSTLFLSPLILQPLLHPSLPFPASSPSPPLSHTHFFKHLICTLNLPPQQQPLNKPLGFKSHLTQIINPNEPTVDGVIEILAKTKECSSEGEAMAFLDESGVQLTESLVLSVIWMLREEWELGFIAFKWGEKSGCCDARVWDLMVWVLGKEKKFGIAWRLIRDMVRSSMDCKQALLIMTESYADANNPSKAIRTFQAMEKFRVIPDSTSFFTLLHGLCKNGNIEEAEEFMMLNKNLFPLGTESFNIILNAWSNIMLDVFEAKRIWREMSKCCIIPDATSYSLMISCFSKVGNLFDSLRLYDEMKKRGWIPGLGVYNSLIYVLTHENCLEEAFKVLDRIKEAGLHPDVTTYNSMVFPLCEAHKLEQARNVLANMIRQNTMPTLDTYHALIVKESVDGTAELLKQMKDAGCAPSGHTFLLILNKLLKLEQPGNAVRMWAEMLKFEVVPDSAHYNAIVGGMVRCGWNAKARKFYDDMRSRGFSDDSNLLKLLEEPIDGDKESRKGRERQRKRYSG